MEQRIYHGNLTPNGLADYLVQHYDAEQHIQAQKLGQGDTLMVQIGEGRSPDHVRGAISVGIAPAPDRNGIVVTMGQQNWLTPGVGGLLVGGLIGAFFTPWALFGLIWPLSHMAMSMGLPQDVWNTIEMYCTSAGGTLGASHQMGGVPCAFCGMMNAQDATTCATCGRDLGTAAAVAPATGPTTRLNSSACPQCGKVNAVGARFCSECGTRLAEQSVA